MYLKYILRYAHFISIYNKKGKENEMICYCFNISRNDIVKEVNQGCEYIRDIRNNTKACMGWGRCNAGVERVAYKAIKDRNKNMEIK